MKLSVLLNKLGEIAKENEIAEPFIVGGLPRDRIFGLPNNIKDIDITTGDRDSTTLALAANREWPNTHFKIFNDGHASLQFRNTQLDFSNNFVLPGIDEELERLGETSTPLKKEMFSRDFTINTLLQPLDLRKDVIDITKLGIEDIKNKILRTPVNPEYTIGYDPRRILRGIKLALKYNLEIMPELKDAMVKYRGGIIDIPVNQVKKQINQMLEINTEKAMKLLTEYKLLPILPLSKLLSQEIVKNKMVQHLFDGGV